MWDFTLKISVTCDDQNLRNMFYLKQTSAEAEANQCDQIGRFFKKFLATKFLNNTTFYVNTVAVTFGATFGKIGQLYFLTCGHTEDDRIRPDAS